MARGQRGQLGDSSDCGITNGQHKDKKGWWGLIPTSPFTIALQTMFQRVEVRHSVAFPPTLCPHPVAH